jgi:peptide/nickel transport system substrate-binding protein
MKKTTFMLLSLVIIATMLAGCGGTPAVIESTAPAATAAIPTEIMPTSVTVAIPVAPAGFDPIGAGNLSVNIFVNMQINCALYGRDASASIDRKLAMSEEKNADGSALIIKVRPDVKFHNGDPVSVDDLIFSYNTFMTSPSGQFLLNYVGPVMTKVDDQTVSVPLVYPNVDYEGVLALVYVVPQALYEKDPAAFNNNPVGCGAYQFVSYTNNELIELKAFADYFEGVAPIETVDAKVITDPSTSAIALEAGEIDVLFSAQSTDLDRLAANTNLKIYKTPSDGTISLGLFRGAAMDNPKVREAMFHAVNPQDALLAARNGDGVLPKDLTNGRNIGVLAGVVDYSNTYDPELAKQLLAESGFDLTTPITLSLCPGYFGADASSAGLSVANNLNAVGFNIVTETLDPNVFGQKWMSGSLELAINKQGYAPMNITDTLNWFTTTGDAYNMYNAAAKSATLDEQVHAARFALTDADYMTAGEAMLNTFYNTYQLLPLYTPNENVIFNAKLNNVVIDPSAYGYVMAFYWTY